MAKQGAKGALRRKPAMLSVAAGRRSPGQLAGWRHRRACQACAARRR
ncbi:hypothetical protein M8494_26565 [Serratia ureilytica]